MNFKLDENFGTRTQELFRSAGHDVQTVFSQGLQGAADRRIIEVCSAEQRCLVTLDLDFSNVLAFPPDQSCGIVVLRLPCNHTLTLLRRLVQQFLKSLEQTPIANQLWIVEPGRIRIHQPASNNGE